MLVLLTAAWAGALLIGALGFTVSRRHRWAGICFALALIAVGVWQYSQLQSQNTGLILLAPGMMVILYHALAAFIVARGLTIIPLVAQRSRLRGR